MGEDRVTTTTAFVDKKNENVCLPPSRQRHSSIISSCSEDMESETNTSNSGYPPTPDEEKEEELEYGPGIVNKLRTRFLSITLKQNRGTSIRRSCSMENLLDQDRMTSRCTGNMLMPSQTCSGNNLEDRKTGNNWGVIKRAKSMDTLLMDLQQQQRQAEPPANPVQSETDGKTANEPKIVRRRDGGLLNRTGPIICDEELPKPDTVKTYKRMFEPAESRRGSYSRRPPVLRASAKSGTLSGAKINNNGVSSSVSSAKVSNGITSKSNISKLCSAKQQQQQQEQSPIPPVIKAQTNPEVISNNTINQQDPSKPLCNGSSFVKATPVKIIDNSVCNNNSNIKIEKFVSEKEINGFSIRKDILLHQHTTIQKKDSTINNICNGTLKEITKSDITNGDDYIKLDVKKLVRQTYKVLDGEHNNKITNIVNGLKPTKPKIPPNRPSFVKNNVKSNQKISELNGVEKKTQVTPKLKSTPNSIHKDIVQKHCPESILNGKTDKLISPISPPGGELKLNGDAVNKESRCKETIESKAVCGDTTKKIVEENNKKNSENVAVQPETAKGKTEGTNQHPPQKEREKEIINQANGVITQSSKNNNKITTSNQKPNEDLVIMKCESTTKPLKKQQSSSSEPITTSMVFDFRGKDVVPHVAVLPVPFGCKALHPKKNRSIRIDGKEIINGDCVTSDDEDEFHMDYSVPPPCGVIFEGENVKIGKGSILCTRNKDLKIKFDDNVDDNTFVYPSEMSLMEDCGSSNSEQSSLSPSPPPTTGETTPPASESHSPSANKLKANTAIGSSGAGGLTTYTPSVLRTMDNFEPGMFRPPPPTEDKEESTDKNVQSGEQENTEVRDEEEEEMLKPADPGIISSWSLSAGTSDLLF